MSNAIMGHIVAGYPTDQACIALMLGMQQAGVTAIEVQIPFSDPMADGTLIMHANDVALDNDTTIARAFTLIQVAQQQGLHVPSYIMSYANKLYSYGFENFCKRAKTCGITGLIIPDLPIDTDDYGQLQATAEYLGIGIVPVLSPGMSELRLKEYLFAKPELVYVTSTKGITGRELLVKDELIELITMLRKQSKCNIALGFGIRSVKQVEEAAKLADIAVVGSAMMQVVDNDGVEAAIAYMRSLVGAKEEKL